MILNVIEYYTVKKNLILTQELWNKVKQRVRNLKVAATDGFWMTVFRDEPPDVEVKGRPLTYGVIAILNGSLGMRERSP